MSKGDQAKILVVDDDQDIRRLIRETLEDEGFAVAEASNGWQALSLVETTSPDLIILDVKMPGIDGEAVATALRLMEGLPVLVVTGAKDVETSVERLGGYGYLRKPFALTDLVDAVCTGLGIPATESRIQ